MSRELKRISVAIGIVEEAGRYLVTRRPAHVDLPGFWEFPGGKIEPGETPQAAAVRELHEELGITVEAVRCLPAIEHAYPHAHVTLTPVLCRHVAGEPQLIHCTEIRWLPLAEVMALEMPAGNATLLKTLADRLHFPQ